MSYCPKCGREVPVGAYSCDACGAELPSDPEESGVTLREEPSLLISPSRIMGMSLISSGLYLFYWFYLTWRQYRVHSGTEAYPVWHALTLLIPIYSWFRVHAHVRAINDMVHKRNIYPALSPLLAVALIATQQALGWVSFSVAYDAELTTSTILSSIILDLIGIVIAVVLMVNVQTSINKFWGLEHGSPVSEAGSSAEAIEQTTIGRTPFSLGEKIIGAVGALMWILTIRQLVAL